MKKNLYISDLLQPHHIRFILSILIKDWGSNKASQAGWITISSPLREDKHPSFALNIYHGGFRDHGRPNLSGDLIRLVQYIKGSNRREAERWVLETLNLKFQNGVLINAK